MSLGKTQGASIKFWRVYVENETNNCLAVEAVKVKNGKLETKKKKSETSLVWVLRLPYKFLDTGRRKLLLKTISIETRTQNFEVERERASICVTINKAATAGTFCFSDLIAS